MKYTFNYSTITYYVNNISLNTISFADGGVGGEQKLIILNIHQQHEILITLILHDVEMSFHLLLMPLVLGMVSCGGDDEVVGRIICEYPSQMFCVHSD